MGTGVTKIKGNKVLQVASRTNKIADRDPTAGKGKLVSLDPLHQTGPTFHQGNQSGGSGQRGRGGNQRKPRVVVMATSKQLRDMADQLDRETGQQPIMKEEVSPRQQQGN